jgi:hypothetical protein
MLPIEQPEVAEVSDASLTVARRWRPPRTARAPARFLMGLTGLTGLTWTK